MAFDFPGINESTVVAGLMGGTVRALLVRGGFINGCISVFIGGAAANYLAPPVALSATLNPWMMTEGTIGFLVGMTGMLICEGVILKARTWARDPKLPVKP